jgi:serine/threonine protein kinase
VGIKRIEAVRKIGKYAIRGLLGRGGMAKVFKVEIPVIGKIVALKLLAPNPHLNRLLGLEAIRHLFVSEAVTMAHLRHPCIASILDFGEHNGQPFYTMEYLFNNLGRMIGESSHTETPSRIIGVDKAIAYCLQTLSGLARLHHEGIIHRDIKPFNLLITDQDTVKICDFGLSKLHGETFSGPPTLKLGSPWYAPAEQESNPDRVDATADLYAVGITCYRMLTGSFPQHTGKPASAINSDLDAPWDRFLQQATAPAAKDRFASARQMSSALQDLAAAWEVKREQTCRMPPVAKAGFHDANVNRLRRQPVKVSTGKAPETFRTDGLFRPRTYLKNDFVVEARGLILDRATGLRWQQAGSPYPVSWKQAHGLIADINRQGIYRRCHWRLPTVDELMSLLTPPPHGPDFCMEPVFDSMLKWLWSCDRRSFMAAWYVSVDMGYVASEDFSAQFFVKAVCGPDG